MCFPALKLLVSRKRWVIRRKLLQTTNSNSYSSFPRSMTLNDIWRSFQPTLSFPRPLSRKIYTIGPQKLKLLTRNHTKAFRWYDCRWPWQYLKVIRLSHIKFLINSVRYSKSYYRLQTGNRTLAFYTVSQRNWGTHIMPHNNHKCGPISIMFSLSYSWMNCTNRLY